MAILGRTASRRDRKVAVSSTVRITPVETEQRAAVRERDPLPAAASVRSLAGLDRRSDRKSVMTSRSSSRADNPVLDDR